MYQVTSEIYKETNFQPTKESNGQILSKFGFRFNTEVTPLRLCKTAKIDKDGDLDVARRHSKNEATGVIEIIHSGATELKLVGLQVWRGSLLLADFLFHKIQEFQNKTLLELGAGVGLTSIAASIYLKDIYCTDVDIGGILDVIRTNIKRNQHLIHGNIDVLEYNFLQNPNEYSPQLKNVIDKSEIIVAADVIYDDTLTDAFIKVLDYIFARAKASQIPKTVYIAMEKRFVFTMSEFDAVAPMFESFINKTMNKSWHFHYIPLDFPQFFNYERCKNLILIQLTHL